MIHGEDEEHEEEEEATHVPRPKPPSTLFLLPLYSACPRADVQSSRPESQGFVLQRIKELQMHFSILDELPVSVSV